MKLMSAPRSLDLLITNQCNQRCKYCAHFTSKGASNDDLPVEEWLQFFEELQKIAVMDVCLQGGEFFCREDWKSIVDGIAKNKMRYNILSNGTLIDEETASFLASTNRCNGVQVSIDGPTSETHDIFRGEGSFIKAVNGINCLQKYNVPVFVRVTIHKNNVMVLTDIAKFLLEEIGLPGFSVNSASFMGLCRQNSEMIQLNVEEYSIARESLLRLNQKYKGRITASAGPLTNGKKWIMMQKSGFGRKANGHKNGFLSACGGSMSKIAVRADGVFIPCVQMSNIELGRMNKDNLRDVWQNNPEMVKLRERMLIPLSKFALCEDCDYIEYCTGGCPAIAYTTVGILDHPNYDDCLKKFLLEGGRIPDESLLLSQE
ncbi:MAG: SynChlorMet cassette radical SAM/SPASM protein ScmE [Nitrospirae bacterium]|nr:SynChlorMet cassette radical SAM/SPASM protein ScmE [Nitrospirota bacterium]